MSKLFVEQVVNGNKTIVSEWNDNEQGAKVAFHTLCKNLWNDAPTEKALVQISDESMKEWEGYKEDIDKTGDDPENPGKLIVETVANNNLDVEHISEWVANKAGVKGAMVNYHSKCADLWNDAETITANVKILNEHLDNWMGKSEYISHEVEPTEE